MQETPYHIPALLPEAIKSLDIKPGGTYVDVTFGGGGHSKAILDQLSNTGRLYSFDQDEDAITNAFNDPRFTFVHSNFRFLENFLNFYGVDSVDGIIADLGVSFHHFDDPERGFSFRWDSPLDMRMNRRTGFTAAEIIANYDQKHLSDLFRIYGELNNSMKIAGAITTRRSINPIKTANELWETVKPHLNPKAEKKELAMLFQALRIEVNKELDVLKKFLIQATRMLSIGGRLVVITYHSLEDRIVKNYMKTSDFTGVIEKDFYGNSKSDLKLLTPKPITPSEKEIKENPRSRSAKMRVAVKI